MTKKYLRFILSIFFLSTSTALLATTAILDGKWLIEHAQDDNLVVLDIQPKEYYRQYHVPGAINAPFSTWKTGKEGKPPGMMHSIKKTSLQLGKLGINEKNQVVIVATGSGTGDMAAMARVFWTFKVLGHKNVAVLDGGLASYANDFKGPLSKELSTRKMTTYNATPDYSIVANSNTVLKAIKSKKSLLDARSRGEYVGVIQGGKFERAGTIPGAQSLPFDWMTINQSAYIRNKKAINTLFKSIGAEKQTDTIHFCHTGNRAALTWFVDYAILNHKNARLYDASMIEWAVDKSKPIKAQIQLVE
jgi:thiosulfate/3-mercaptopyruvate sulfurtransferase